MSDNAADDEQTPRSVDVHVGKLVRQRRILLGIGHEDFSQRLSLSMREVRNYEQGIDRINAARLFAIAEVLNVPVSFFFADEASGADAFIASRHAPPEAYSAENVVLLKPEELRLVQAFSRITESAVQERIYGLVKSLASEG